MNPDQQSDLDLQEQCDLGPHCFSKRLQKYFSKRQKHTTFCDICFWFNKWEFSVGMCMFIRSRFS